MSSAVRVMTFADVTDIMRIETSVFTLPWKPQVFTVLMRRDSSICLVWIGDHELSGYLVADMFVDVWHIMNLAVRPERRRNHIAADLLEAYFEIAERHPHRGHTLEVRLSNEAAIELYRSFGFIATGVHASYYSDDYEDALIMWKDWEGESA